MKTCKYCNASGSDNDVFCQKCGSAFQNNNSDDYRALKILGIICVILVGGYLAFQIDSAGLRYGLIIIALKIIYHLQK